MLGRYAEAFAYRLFRLHELEIEAARLKREAELVRARINSGRRSLQLIEPTLTEGDHLVLRREAENPYDVHAIAVLSGDGDKLGYLPRDRNEIPARLMDAGKLLFARLESKSWLGDWLQLSAG